ncbi:hypothetical protein DFR70_1021040 [Nocardia tenerifensis]|uniref:Uncharacterized protein n=1 Tax=Nocardia tenerifensis TaxID=228006 RepID=A0A318KX64_9NOCA|nr:hypothetical protein [Nocardia tenerifensis]PXX69351.1 hypothetical protein DFR70_1021040 [Nocardia tenerifensis]
MTTTERDETSVTVTSVAPALIGALRRAAARAHEHGHTCIGTEDLLLAILEAGPLSALEVWWPRENTAPIQRGIINDVDPTAPQRALTFDELKSLVAQIVPTPSPSDESGPSRPVTVHYELSGPNADRLRQAIEQQS